jgi:hypothetical protein
MKKSIILSMITIAIVALMSCKKNKDIIAPSDPSVYVAGSERAVGTSNRVAKYWKDGVAIALSDSTKNADAYAVYVNGNDVYVAGFENNGTKDVAKYWKNGVAIALTNGNTNAIAKSIFVSGSDVYVVGNEYNGTKYIAKLWKNGISSTLTSGTYDSDANAVYVNGNDVYVTGYERNSSNFELAKYWKNGIETILTNSTSFANGYSITVNGNDVYVAGYEYTSTTSRDVAKYWKISNGGTPQVNILSDGTNNVYANGIAINGTDVYIAGLDEDDRTAKVWKNGVSTNLASPGANYIDAYAVFVQNNDVYCAGASFNGATWTACYWKNGTEKKVTNSTKTAFARAIFVK